MLLIRQGRYRGRRRGVILLVVLTLLTLFALVGVSFVLVANSMETSARIAREAESQTSFTPALSAQAAFNLTMAQLLYDANDDSTGALSALRGQSLARNMYGWNPAALNDKPYVGHGRLSFTSAMSEDDIKLLNYQYNPGDSFVRDPERIGTRSDPNAAMTSAYVAMGAVPYTYPDHNNFYLAQIDPSTGQVLVPSFHREYIFGQLDQDDATNPNWKNQVGKYKTLRPTNAAHPNFPKPAGRNGDVKNLVNAPGGPDSLWIDIGAPVLTAADGRKYKMLVAPLILDLDGRANLNVIGNLMGSGQAPCSNQGWGPWEINPKYVLAADATEWQTVFNGSTAKTPEGYSQVPGRYDNGTSAPTILGPPIAGTRLTRAWAQVDYDAKKSDGTASSPFLLPIAGQPGSYFSFPTFVSGTTSLGYDNGGATENTGHASIYNPFRPQAPNRLLGLDGLARLLMATGSTTAMSKSELFDLLPNNLGAANTVQRRNLLTTLSADLDRPGGIPYAWDPADTTNTPTTRYQLMQPDTAQAEYTLSGNAPIAFPAYNTLGTKPPMSEYNLANWIGSPAALARLDLDRPLTSYTSNPAQALADRQAFARDIFDVLRRVTGAMDPGTAAGASYGTSSPEFRALRKLAQIAVNIVDTIDEDDISTPFRWYLGGTTNEYVFGTELPRLVINETYVQYDNAAGSIDTGTGFATTTANYNVNVWVELMNPLPEKDFDNTTSNPAHHVATLYDTANSRLIYRVVLAQPDLNKTDPASMVLRDPANTTGDPDFGSATSRIVSTLADWGPTTGAMAKPQAVTPLPDANRFSSAATGAAGFYVLGPSTSYVAGADPSITVTFASPNMTYPLTVASQDNAATRVLPQPTILLQRLADPTRAYNNSNADPTTYNPYVTVDLVNLPEYTDGRIADSTQTLTPPGMTTRTSYGRKQPFHGHASGRVAQDPTPAPTAGPKHTFYRQNCKAQDQATLDSATTDTTLTLPFDWLVHLDRPPISPMELLHVSQYAPHELTTRFINGGGGSGTMANQQAAPWLIPTTRLYRFFEFATCGLRGSGFRPTAGGRIPGKININSVWWNPATGNSEVFRALCDPQPGNWWSGATNVDVIFNNLLDSRSPASRAANKPVIQPTHLAFGANLDRPFGSLGMGESAGQDNLSGTASTPDPRGLNNTLLRSVSGQLLFDVGAATDVPYRRKELLTKIFNNVTTRSNTFAVWLTVGFFEVRSQPAGGPPELGDEIGKAENRQVRYRMFALVDRTHLKAFDNSLSAAVSAGQNQPVTLNWSGGTAGRVKDDNRTNREWDIPSGTFLVVDANDPYNEETVVVTNNGGNLTATFQRGHASGAKVICRGNPGPWKGYDARKDTEVVPYFTILE